METILEYLLANWPTFAIVIIVGVTCFVASRKLTKWEDKHDQKHDKLESRCGNHEAELTVLKSNLESMRDDILTIKNILVLKDESISNIFSLKKSQHRLNDNGVRVFGDINGKTFLEANKDFFFSKIDERNPKAALDVEDAAYWVLLANTDNDIFKPLKDFVYKSPTYTLKGQSGEDKPYNLSLQDVCFILSLPLRDMYLEQHRELNVE